MPLPFLSSPFWPLDLLELVLSLVVVVVLLISFIDASVRPAAAYDAASKQSKGFWLVILGVATAATVFLGAGGIGGGGLGIFGIIGLIAALVYLVDVRPAIRDLRRGGY